LEPVPPRAALLRENVAALPACVVHEHALSHAPGRLPLTYYPGAAAMSGLYADPRRDAALVRTVLVNSGVRRGFHVVREQEPLMCGTDVHMLYATR
jgi:hypothetical protein